MVLAQKQNKADQLIFVYREPTKTKESNEYKQQK